MGGITGTAVLIGGGGSVFSLHATRGGCCGGHVGDASASSKRSVMSTALPASGPVTPARHTAIGVRLPSAW